MKKQNYAAIVFLSLVSSLISLSFVFAQESITFSTYYPSPYGSYDNLTTGNFTASNNVTLATAQMDSRVGIGTPTPAYRLDVAGLIRAQHPFFIASSSDAWRAGSGWNTVVHNQVIAGNSGSWYNPGNGRFTAPVRGLYLFIAQHYIYSAASGAAYIHHTIGVNGDWDGNGNSSTSGSYTIFAESAATYDSSTSTTTLLYLNAGDYVNDNVYVSSAANYMYGAYSFFQGYYYTRNSIFSQRY